MADAADLNEDFADILAALAEAEADFVVVGAHALAAHGLVRSTGDLDVLVRPDADNARRVVAALSSFGAPLSTHGVSEADFTRPGTVYQLGLPPRRIDILTSISGVSFEEAARDAIAVTRSGASFRVPSRAALLANKRASGRPRDLEDARLLESLDSD